MKRFVRGQHRIVDYAGLHGAFPVLHRTSGEPSLMRPDDEETAYRRVGWTEFFGVCEDRGYVLLFEDTPETFDFQFVNEDRARRETHARSRFARGLAMLRHLPAIEHA